MGQRTVQPAPNKITVRKPLGEVLVEMGLLTSEAIRQGLEQSVREKVRLGELLVREGLIDERQLAQALAIQYNVDYVELAAYVPSTEALKLLSEKIMRGHLILPLEIRDEVLTLAVHDPLAAVNLDHVLKMMGVPYVIKVAPHGNLSQAIQKALDSQRSIDTLVQSLVREDVTRKRSLSAVPKGRPAAGAGPVAGAGAETEVSIERLVDMIIAQAVQGQASDIHIDPAEDRVRIRVRVDGLLHLINTYPIELHANVISRLKVLARMDISEKRLPQDGRFPFATGQKSVDIRISTLPTIRGEKAVMRIIDKSLLKGTFTALGMDQPTEQKVARLLQSPHGILFVTGPTGSGKTTTLYAMLSQINDMGKNIVTVEDPVEYQFDLINQVQVHEKAGLTFAGILRNILRQDPDVIMIGEVRDQSTADLAIQAALTGHLVLSTLHTNDAVSTPTRLADIGIEPFLLSSAMLGVLSQRLVRVLCPACKQKTKLREDEALLLGRSLVSPGAEICARKGCEKCYHTGYSGRVSLFEILVPDKTMEKMLNERKSESELLAYAESQGFRTMRKDGVAKILAGVTSVEEVVKATL